LKAVYQILTSTERGQPGVNPVSISGQPALPYLVGPRGDGHRVVGDHDGGRGLALPAGQPLPQLLRDEGHEGVQQPQASG